MTIYDNIRQNWAILYFDIGQYLSISLKSHRGAFGSKNRNISNFIRFWGEVSKKFSHFQVPRIQEDILILSLLFGITDRECAKHLRERGSNKKSPAHQYGISVAGFDSPYTMSILAGINSVYISQGSVATRTH